MGKRKLAAARTARPLQVGDAVRAKYLADKPPPRFLQGKSSGRGYYFRGQVCGVHADGCVDVYFADGHFEARVVPQFVTRTSHSVLRRWRSSGHDLIGRRLLISVFEFDKAAHRAFGARVVAWTEDGGFFHVVHDDDDEEALTEVDIWEGIKRLEAGACTGPAATPPPPPLAPQRPPQGSASAGPAGGAGGAATPLGPPGPVDDDAAVREALREPGSMAGVREMLRRARAGAAAPRLQFTSPLHELL